MKKHKLLTFNIASTLAIVIMMASIIVLNTNDSYAVTTTTTYKCDSGYKLLTSQLKCCPTKYSDGITNNKCYANCMVNKAGGGQVASLCYGGAPKQPTIIQKKVYSVVFNAAGGSAGSKTLTCSTSAGGSTCSVTTPSPGYRSGYTFQGWSQNSSCTYVEVQSMVSLSVSSDRTYTACWKKDATTAKPAPGSQTQGNLGSASSYVSSGSSGNSGEPANTCPKSTNTTKVEVEQLYEITYNLDGGHFLDGSTTRKEYVNSTKAVGDLKLNPLKNGYRFVEWQDSNGRKFDFSTKPTSNMTLKATYEKVEEKYFDDYSCPDNTYTLDPSNGICYKLLEFGSDGSKTNVYMTPEGHDNDTPTLGTAYNYTNYQYAANQRFCWGWNSPNEGDSGKISFNSGNWNSNSTVGKNNATYYYKEGDNFVKYDKQDWWKSEDTCKVGTTCSYLPCVEESNYGACNIKYSAIIYKEVEATTKLVELKDEEITLEDDDNNTEGDNDITDETTTDDNKSSGKESEVVSTNAKTGILSVLIIALIGAIALINIFSYVNKTKEEKV